MINKNKPDPEKKKRWTEQTAYVIEFQIQELRVKNRLKKKDNFQRVYIFFSRIQQN